MQNATYLSSLSWLQRGLIPAGIGAERLLLQQPVGGLQHSPHAHVAGVQQRGYCLGGL